MPWGQPDGPTMTPAELALWTRLAETGQLHTSFAKYREKWTAWFEMKAKSME